MVFNETITYGTETIDILGFRLNVRQKTAKQTVGNQLVILGPALGVATNENATSC